MAQNPIFVSRSVLPSIDDLMPHLRRLWDTRVLTNQGEYHNKLEVALAEYLGVEHLTLVANATLGLMLALRLLGRTGEVVTTPFSFVATAHAIAWAGCTPVFTDIDPETLNLDPARLAEALTPETVAILPVHCFGRACDTAAIEAIARERGVPVLYDAAHAFGVRVAGESLLRSGDLSVLSLHATKVFHSCEGGAIVSPNAETKRRFDCMRNFGIIDEKTVESIGLNAKMSELHALVALLQLPRVEENIRRRAAVAATYRRHLSDVFGIRCFETPENHTNNHGYFPILVQPGFRYSRDTLWSVLRDAGIFARRYFFPLLSQLPMYRELPSANPARLPVATRVADEILCLPIYPELSPADQQRVIDVVLG